MSILWFNYCGLDIRRQMMARRKLQKRSFDDIARGSFGGLIFAARKQHVLTQAQLAEKIERDRPWLSDVETGKITHVLDEDIRALAHALGLDVDQLLSARNRSSSRLSPEPENIGMRQTCNTCGKSNPSTANFCSNCGEKLPENIECPACHLTNRSEANFCNGCGEPL